MTQYGFYFNGQRCTGCKACVMACKDKNDLAETINFRNVLEYGGGTWTRADDGTWGTDTFAYNVSVACNHCDMPACLGKCPQGALTKDDETGAVLRDEEKCIGCKYCMMACPYGVRSWNAAEKCAEKCTLCGHLTSQDKLPACVKSCAAGARFYGDLDDPDSDASKELAKYSEGDIHTLQDVGNHPATRYIMTSMIGQWQDRIAPADHPHTAAYPVAE